MLVEGDTEGKEFPKNHSVDAAVTVSPLGPPFMELTAGKFSGFEIARL